MNSLIKPIIRQAGGMFFSKKNITFESLPLVFHAQPWGDGTLVHFLSVGVFPLSRGSGGWR